MKRREFIRKGTLTLGALGCSNGAFAFLPPKFYEDAPESPDRLPFRKDETPRDVREAVEGFLWLDAADFADYGGWALDTQFAAFMGSSYLIAAGASNPVKNAETNLEISSAGKYRLWARSRNWIKGYAPGIFKIGVGGKFSETLFGSQNSDEWCWRDGGVFELGVGKTALSIKDMTGDFGRCSSIILTRDLDYAPPKELDAFCKERRRLMGLSEEAEDLGETEVVVCGAGPAGCAAAIAAARMGAKTVLICDRPVVGGNASDEIGVITEGAARWHKDKFMREGGIIEEAVRLGKANGWLPNLGRALQSLIDAEPNISLIRDARVVGASKSADRISGVDIVSTLSGLKSKLRGKIFMDCTGDAWLGYYAGAQFRLGREGRDEFGESAAPAQPDSITMSGTLRGSRDFFKRGMFYRTREHASEVKFKSPAWVYAFSDAWKAKRGAFKKLSPSITRGEWWFEHDGKVDDLFAPEEARDELLRINYSFWNYVKNEWEKRELCANYSLEYLPFMTGKRETRRLVGDHILSQDELTSSKHFDDVIGHTGWSLDVHSPLGIFDPNSAYDCDIALKDVAEIPYRCLYSKNIANLLMAGRNASVSHIALGTVRVQAQCALMGQAGGTAAALCLKYKLSPRELGKMKTAELQQRLLRDDQYIPKIKNSDPADLARLAKVSADSFESADTRPENVVNGWARQIGSDSNMWESSKSKPLPQSVFLDFEKPVSFNVIQCAFNTNFKPNSLHSEDFPRECVKKFFVECSLGGKWKRVLEVDGNFKRLFSRKLSETVSADKIRLCVEETYGEISAQIFEIRLYNEKRV